MYVRWQSRKRQRPAFGGWHGEVRDEFGYVYNKRDSLLRTRKRADGSIGQDVRWTAVLVESVRTCGQPRSRHIALLGSITESGMEIDSQRRHFWDAVLDRLDRLANRISIEDRRRIEVAIALKVPRLSREEHDASIKRSKEFFAGFGYQPAIDYKPYRPPTI